MTNGNVMLAAILFLAAPSWAAGDFDSNTEFAVKAFLAEASASLPAFSPRASRDGVLRVRLKGTAEDVALLSPVLESLYPSLPPDLKKTVDAGLVAVIGRSALDVKYADAGALGYGPEDDPDYRGDQTLYPKGTVKFTFTPYILDLIRLADRFPRKERESILLIIGSTFVHEVTHVNQYLRGPISALGSSDVVGEDGECDERKLAATRTKLEDYELSGAFVVDWDYEQSHGGVDRVALKAYVDLHPEVFDGFLKGRMDLFQRRGLQERTGPVKDYQREAYKSGYRYIEMAREYKMAFAALEQKGASSQKQQALSALQRLVGEWEAHKQIVGQYKVDPVAIYDYLKPVAPKLERSYQRAKGLLDQDESAK